MNTSKLQFKLDTGNNATLHAIDTLEMIEKIDSDDINGFDEDDLKTFIKWQKTWECIDLNKIPGEYVKAEKLQLPNPEYIKWLEDKIETLTNQ